VHRLGAPKGQPKPVELLLDAGVAWLRTFLRTFQEITRLYNRIRDLRLVAQLESEAANLAYRCRLEAASTSDRTTATYDIAWQPSALSDNPYYLELSR
jgi:hypothetical protein